jgi:hypothetical protein
MFYIRVIYDIFCFFILCNNLINASNQTPNDIKTNKNKESLEKSSNLLLALFLFLIPIELLVYFISLKSAQKR